jgi:2-(1,2-epoxy-1,2-dihydrophenyl)acetyl-CoA isomerase
MRTDFERAYVTAHGNVAVLTFNHPEVMNAASAKLVAGATEALKFIERSDFRALVLTGEGKGFCSGANLSDRGSGQAMEPGESLQVIFHPFLRRLRDVKLPFITAVNGAAAGVGMSIALMGDLILASRSADFLQAFARIGLVPDGGSTWL